MMLWHYTCAHVAGKIGRRGMLIPHPQLLLPGAPRLIWLTDVDGVDGRESVGLTSVMLTCDRMQFRYIVRDADVRPFRAYADAQGWASVDWLRTLVWNQGPVEPARWWVLAHATLGTLDRAYSPSPPKHFLKVTL